MYLSGIIFPFELLSIVSPLCNKMDDSFLLVEVLSVSVKYFFYLEGTGLLKQHLLLWCCCTNWVPGQ